MDDCLTTFRRLQKRAGKARQASGQTLLYTALLMGGTSQVFAAKITPYRAEQRQLVLREYQLLRRLHHPHLVQLHCAFITSGYLVLVEELCPGKELLYSLTEVIVSEHFLDVELKQICASLRRPNAGFGVLFVPAEPNVRNL
uniref:Protein kinase domain-containing protein n=1 Tax=Neolamprologus brichardi TaxID=32507 RepID=A0A3Q4HU48_NEOBR